MQNSDISNNITGVLNEKIFKIDLLLALSIVWQSPSILWLIINFRGKILSAPQSQLAVYYEMYLPARIFAMEPKFQPAIFFSSPFFASKLGSYFYASQENNKKTFCHNYNKNCMQLILNFPSLFPVDLSKISLTT